MNKESAPQPSENPYINLPILDPLSIKSLDMSGHLFSLSMFSELLIEGITLEGEHVPLATVQLDKDLIVRLDSIGRNVRNPQSPTNKIGVFTFDRDLVKNTANQLRESAIIPPKWTKEKSPVKMFFAMNDYFRLGDPGNILDDINDIHIIANLTQDPRIINRYPSKNFRFRRDDR